MAIRKRGKSWQIDVLVPTGEKDAEGRDIRERIRKTFKKKKDAEAEHDKMRTLVREQRFLDVKKEYTYRLGELVERYSESFQHQPSFKTWKGFCLERFKEHFGEQTVLSAIRYGDVEAYRNSTKIKLTKNGRIRTGATVNREMSCLHHLFSKAVEWEMMERNPFDRGKSLILKENNKRLRYLTKEEIPKLLGECSAHLWPIVVCALNTGMRRGEILGLKWDQIRNGFMYLQKTKTNEAREIPVSDDLATLFKEIRKKKHLKSEYVFTDSKERTLKSIKKGFVAAVKRAGINDFKFHDLRERHTFASHMVMRGAGLKDVQEILGHKDLKMTMRYAHLSREHKKKAVNLLSGLTASTSSCHKMSQNQDSDVPAPLQLIDFSGRDAGI